MVWDRRDHYRCGNNGALQDAKQRKSQITPFGPYILLSLHAHRVVTVRTSKHPTSIGQSPIIPRKFFPCQLESYEINVSNKSGRAIALPAPPPPRSLVVRP